MLITPVLLLFASVIPCMADSPATTGNIFMTIQTIDVSSVSIPRPLTGSCIGTDCIVGTETESHCVEVCTGNSACARACGSTAAGTETGGGFSIQTDSTSNPVTVPQATTGLLSTVSDTGVMSIPSGEVTVSRTASRTASAPAQSSGTASRGQSTGDGAVIRLVLTLSMLSITFGFVWTLI
ncbi:uncharacterized protein BDR25DRAFT_347092 [Lindgomyces ingoldianus]|uniref:Uncharacterized protein n=1 Tax=Lindgomyces ingoldianus TaxID=673940 RepID=A0ACB6QAH4_9PLEO|nr:uncharacterized protein BDR25DRAFT_347092 [Lindgomyces ingoldianus]KAF2463583.1 hypothetical protein BDR25DRAFT_347092 [Lindgomyces ingoldianus]